MPGAATQTMPAPTAESLDVMRLYRDHGEFVRSLLGRLLGPAGDADDLTQEVFLVAMRRVQTEEVRAPRAWLCRIAVNLAATTRRNHRVRRLFGMAADPDATDWRTPESLADANERIRTVQAMLEKISEKKRTVFILFEVQGLSGQEIAEVLGCPLQTVHTRLFHARREFVALHQQARVAAADRKEALHV